MQFSRQESQEFVHHQGNWYTNCVFNRVCLITSPNGIPCFDKLNYTKTALIHSQVSEVAVSKPHPYPQVGDGGSGEKSHARVGHGDQGRPGNATGNEIRSVRFQQQPVQRH